MDRLTALTRRHRSTAVLGPSGSGKSSLLRAAFHYSAGPLSRQVDLPGLMSARPTGGTCSRRRRRGG
ncbi:hypothetical protein [Streptomyces uncialis]|uniref:nSTAND1 domain-containing NTPase n=1 Tax=Streptomyces uncialis TaxID=1048205 RepID=UPI00386642A6